jgi:hypothetical protein
MKRRAPTQSGPHDASAHGATPKQGGVPPKAPGAAGGGGGATGQQPGNKRARQTTLRSFLTIGTPHGVSETGCSNAGLKTEPFNENLACVNKHPALASAPYPLPRSPLPQGKMLATLPMLARSASGPQQPSELSRLCVWAHLPMACLGWRAQLLLHL